MNDLAPLMDHPNGSFYNRCGGRVHTFIDMLSYCTEPESNDEYEGYEYYGSFGGLFYQEDKTEKFSTIADFMEAANYIRIGDMINTFRFGIGDHKLTIERGVGREEERNSDLEKFWIPTIHYRLGLCYSFEPNNHGFGMVPVLVTEQSSIEQRLNELEIVFQVG